MALQDLSDELFIEAVGRCLKHCTFVPVPSEIRRHAEEILTEHGILPSEPEPAWESVLKMARRWAPGAVMHLEDQAISRTVSELGGIGRIAMATDYEVTFLRKEFLSRYAIYRQRAIDNSTGVFAQMLDGAEKRAALSDGDGA